MCIAEGFPSVPFLVNEDLTRQDGAIQCRQITTAEALQFTWRLARAIKIVLDFPVPF